MIPVYLKSWSNAWIAIAYDPIRQSFGRRLASRALRCRGFSYKFKGKWIFVYVYDAEIYIAIDLKPHLLSQVSLSIFPNSEKSIQIEIRDKKSLLLNGIHRLCSFDYLATPAEIASEDFFLWLNDLCSSSDARSDMIQYWQEKGARDN